jgi:hypothetical protein
MPHDQNTSEADLEEEYSRLEASLKSCRAVVSTYRERIANDPQPFEPDSRNSDPQAG